MPSSTLQALRFARGWNAPPADLRADPLTVSLSGEGDSVPGTLVGPNTDRPLPGWVVMHGITRLGREHPALRRFVRALAATGARVLVPEVAEWTRLELAPQRAQTIVQGAIHTLADHPSVEPGGVAVAGFSFGGPQVLHAAAAESGARVRGVLAWGSYADLERTLRFHFTGEHGFDESGRPRFHDDPDPYGRWVVGYNCLPLLEGRGDLRGVAEALRSLASLAGERVFDPRSVQSDGAKLELRSRLTPSERECFDLFAPPAGRCPHREGEADAIETLIRELTEAAHRTFPLLDPLPDIGGIQAPVRLLHGRDDHLIPFTETEELARLLADRVPDLGTGITGLFGHSDGAGGGPTSGIGGAWARTRDNVHFLRVLRRAFEVV